MVRVPGIYEFSGGYVWLVWYDYGGIEGRVSGRRSGGMFFPFLMHNKEEVKKQNKCGYHSHFFWVQVFSFHLSWHFCSNLIASEGTKKINANSCALNFLIRPAKVNF